MTYRTLLRLSTLLLVALISLPSDGTCQSKRTKKKETESEWLNNVWFGGGFNLGFNIDNYNGYQSNYFVIGISPMAGYKVNSFISIGPRFSIDWTIAKYSNGFSVLKYNSVDFGLGVFARIKFLQNFFAHFEYSQLNETYGYIVGNTLEKERQWRDLAMIGLGYHSNTKWGYEIYINYNFLEEDNSLRLPIIYRFGITYNFNENVD
jgi:hypothetical protein